MDRHRERKKRWRKEKERKDFTDLLTYICYSIGHIVCTLNAHIDTQTQQTFFTYRNFCRWKFVLADYRYRS